MDFGRIPDVGGVDFALPAEPAANAARGAPPPADGDAPRVWLGAPVWAHDGFVAKIYPPRTARGDMLAAYARQFDAIELNSTWYGVDRERIARWADATPASFRFAAKLPRTITHEGRLGQATDDARRFLDDLAPFGPRLGIVWGVLPEAFGPRDLPALANFVRAWPDDVPLAIELRHPAFFAANGPGRPDPGAFDLLAAHGVTAIVTDVAGRRDVLHMRLTTAHAFVRYCGNGLHPSDFARLDDWVERLRLWRDRGVRDTWFFLHQPVEHHTVELAEHLAPRLAARLGATVRAPERVRIPNQGSLFGD